MIASEGIDSLTPYVRDFLKTYGDKMGPKYAMEAEGLLMRYNAQVQEKVFLHGFSAIVMPALLTPYVAADWFSSPENATVIINGKQVESHMGFFTTWMWNLLGRHPVVNVPNGMTGENIPLGLQIISNTFDNLTAFQLASLGQEWRLNFTKQSFPIFRDRNNMVHQGHIPSDHVFKVRPAIFVSRFIWPSCIGIEYVLKLFKMM